MVFHARTDPCEEALVGRCVVRSEPVARLVAVMAGSYDIGPMPATVLLSDQVLGGGL